MAIVTRAGKGSALTHTEMDANLNEINLKAPIDLPVFTGTTSAPVVVSGVYGSGQNYTGANLRTSVNGTAGSTFYPQIALFHPSQTSANITNTLRTNAVGDLAFSTSTQGSDTTFTDKMILTATSKLLVGTSTDNGTDRLQVNGSISATTFKGQVERPASTGFGQRIEIGTRASGRNINFRITPLTSSNENYGVIIRAKYAAWENGIGMVDYIISCRQTETSVIQNLIGTHFGISPVLSITPSNVIISGGGGVTGSFDIAISVNANCNAQLEIDSIFSMPSGCSITQI
jgi:hypothetical protein